MPEARAATPEFRPPLLLRSASLQTVLASLRPSAHIWKRRGIDLEARSTRHVIPCADGVRLLGYTSEPDGPARGLVALLHGWEGDHNSRYLHSLACRLLQAGYSVFRLVLRDHADSHYLNEALFHSARIGEVLDAIAWAHARAPGPLWVVGFSLGGSFALRTGLYGPARGLVPRLSIGISPAINPGAALAALDAGPGVFRHNFLHHWRASLVRKAAAWPGALDLERFLPRDSLVEATRRFAEHHTEFGSYEAYLAAYTLSPQQLRTAPSPLAIITAQDDPMIPYADFAALAPAGALRSLDAPRWGGHCGFIENLRLESWAERRVLQLLAA